MEGCGRRVVVGRWRAVYGRWRAVDGRWSVVGDSGKAVDGRWSVVGCGVLGGRWRVMRGELW